MSTILAPVRPSAPIRERAQARMIVELEAMHASIVYWLTAQWRKDASIIVANDADPTRQLQEVLRKRGGLWRRRYKEAAENIAAELTGRTRRHVDRALQKMLSDNGITIKFRMTRSMRQTVQAGLNAQVSLISDIATKHVQQVEGAVMRALQTGTNLQQLTTDLEQTLGVSRRRAIFIARDQTNKATATMADTRALELGCEEGEWLHSAGGKHPRPSHVAFSRKRYKLGKGAYLDGKWTLPGVEPNCRCVGRPILPSLGARR